MFSLYCYQQTRPDEWRLRAFVPINDYYFTNPTPGTIHFEAATNYVKATYGGSVVFTVAATASNKVPQAVAY
jgi:hypothetical protein